MFLFFFVYISCAAESALFAVWLDSQVSENRGKKKEKIVIIYVSDSKEKT